MRNRAWRRYMQEKIVTKRLKLKVAKFGNWYFYTSRVANRRIIQSPMFKDYIGTDDAHMLKTYKTTNYDTKNKIKYSPNRSERYERDLNTREKQKIEFLKILKEYGIK